MSISSINTLPEITLEGFQVVKADMFIVSYNRQTITLSIWNDEISFSKAALDALHGCERVRIEVNAQNKCILVVPVTIQDKDNVRWSTITPDAVKPRKISCVKFTRLLYETWGWNQELAYKVEGKVVTSNKKLMLLFDFRQAKNWKCAKAIKNE